MLLFYTPWKNQKIWFLMILVRADMEYLLEMVQFVCSQRFFLIWFFSTSTKPRNSTESITLKNKNYHHPPDSSKIVWYKNFDELSKCITKLSLLSYWKINCGNTVHLYKIDPIYENPVLDIFVSDTFNFIIRVFA